MDKCKVLHTGKYNPCHVYYTNNSYSESLTVSNSERDLGVVSDSFLNFDLHINGCISRANRVLGIIHRSFSYLDKRMFILLYKTIVRPILEYGNSIWSPLYKRQSISIENVQRRATRMLYGLKYLSYEQRLVLLDLPSLKYRRLRGDLIQLYKIVHNANDLDQSDFFTFSTIKFTRGDQFKIYISRCNTRIRQISFINRIVKTWNSIRFETKNVSSVDRFKVLIDEELNPLRHNHD